jgi:hypothetical protein
LGQLLREGCHRGDATDAERHLRRHGDAAGEEGQHLSRVRGGKGLQEQQRDPKEEARPRHRRTEA